MLQRSTEPWNHHYQKNGEETFLSKQLKPVVMFLYSFWILCTRSVSHQCILIIHWSAYCCIFWDSTMTLQIISGKIICFQKLYS